MAESKRKASHRPVQAYQSKRSQPYNSNQTGLCFLSGRVLAQLPLIVPLEPSQYYQVELQGLSPPDNDRESGWGIVRLLEGDLAGWMRPTTPTRLATWGVREIQAGSRWASTHGMSGTFVAGPAHFWAIPKPVP
ncbi:hypothetical protein SNOG_16296 [Parastagonospora nodorum SN15]|uniref:Uncharacterized protein n=2 Tax=Phaeosphaeria nodorum (strain SN15 / ATCC MYA-4574 / FGSC 10173) TaxID=321614 RepID=A0A7U2ID44_PHANO|nr:hypothetical protein SNOG_16296 [Parastagonospora nodorum SN15]EAT76282.1 hypothetical protein SNOG_16296 [Parastagonospora nodorum SN15]QRD07611.1 hypothetical protein JI435_162960 [Parastagonospora nodorum SN15]